MKRTGSTTGIRLEPYHVALLRGGARAAVTVAVVALHLRGVVAAGRPGALRRALVPDAARYPPHRNDLERAVRGGLYRPAGLEELLARSVVRTAVARAREDLVAAGLLGSLTGRPTRAGRRKVRKLRAVFPLPTGPEGFTHDDMALAVALYGDPALRALLPRFTEHTRLTGRGAHADAGRFPFGRTDRFLRSRADDDDDGSGPGADHGGGHDGGGFSCGGGGGGGD
ncbi:TIGR04222 domain-containing membrane protein [Streptomyces sp. NPDC090994]|uniref:TIGR04222 domain-containing membrane protein n=1 Tax=Streptomyces sp. NPDC090994 TaxID=3365969 RepID=UPI0037F8D6FC